MLVWLWGGLGTERWPSVGIRSCSDWKNKHYSCSDTWIVGMLVLWETRTPVKNGWDSDEPLIKEVPHLGSDLYLVSFLKLGESFQLSLKTRKLHWSVCKVLPVYNAGFWDVKARSTGLPSQVIWTVSSLPWTFLPFLDPGSELSVVLYTCFRRLSACGSWGDVSCD